MHAISSQWPGMDLLLMDLPLAPKAEEQEHLSKAGTRGAVLAKEVRGRE